MKKNKKRSSRTSKTAKDVIQDGIKKVMAKMKTPKFDDIERLCSVYVHHVFPAIVMNKSRVNIKDMSTSFNQFVESSNSMDDMINEYVNELMVQLME